MKRRSIGNQEDRSEENSSEEDTDTPQLRPRRCGAPKLPATKMTKTQVIRYMAEQMEVPPKQVAGFFNSADRDRDGPDPEARRVHDPWLGQAGEGAACGPDRPQPGHRRGDQDQGQDDGEVPVGQGRQGRGGPAQGVMLISELSCLL